MAENGSPERVPVEMVCPVCGGSGTTLGGAKRQQCGRCNGSGRVRY
jgi:DnaJ-class molecular chaperone